MHQNQQMLKLELYLLKYQHTTYYFGQKILDSSRILSPNSTLKYFSIFTTQSSSDFQLQEDPNTSKVIKCFHIDNQIIETDFLAKSTFRQFAIIIQPIHS